MGPTGHHEKTGVIYARLAQIIEMQKATDVWPKGYAYRLKISVERWLKGSGNKAFELIDTTGTDCDEISGVNHIVMQRDPLSFKWKIYLKN